MKYIQLLYLSADFPNLSNSIWNVLFQGLISFKLNDLWMMSYLTMITDLWQKQIIIIEFNKIFDTYEVNRTFNSKDFITAPIKIDFTTFIKHLKQFQFDHFHVMNTIVSIVFDDFDVVW